MREALVHLAPRFALRGGVSKQRGFQICTPPQSFTLLDKVEDSPSTLSISNKKYAFCIIAPSSYLTGQGDHREKIIFLYREAAANRKLQLLRGSAFSKIRCGAPQSESFISGGRPALFRCWYLPELKMLFTLQALRLAVNLRPKLSFPWQLH